MRQSRDGTWSEVFGDGDIDYRRLVRMLDSLRIRPHVVLEQAAETGTPNTLAADEAMRRSADAVRALFAPER
jgi:inosose dehydratase